MRVTIQGGDSRPIYVQIMDEVRRALVVGTLCPDDHLPSVRELASELRVNPNTVSQAYRELERDGVVYTRRGRGTFVAPDARPDSEERRALARDVARRALVDAHRAGLGVEELVEALAEVADAASDGGTGASSTAGRPTRPPLLKDGPEADTETPSGTTSERSRETTPAEEDA